MDRSCCLDTLFRVSAFIGEEGVVIKEQGMCQLGLARVRRWANVWLLEVDEQETWIPDIC